MIIHTVSFRIKLDYEDNFAFRGRIRNSQTMFIPRYVDNKFSHYSSTYKDVRFIFDPKKYKHNLLIECEVDKIIGESNVIEDDLIKFEEQFSRIVQEFLKMNFPIIITKYPLFRIDYKYDIRFQNDLEIAIFYEIISKTKDRCHNLNKIKPDDKDKTSLYYRPNDKIDNNGKKHFKRGRMNLNCYHRYYKTHKEEDRYVIRVEVQVFAKKINEEYNKYHIAKELVKYWNEDSYSKYMRVYEDVLYTQDYYRIDVAINKVKEVKRMRPATKKRICRLLELINKLGESKGRKKFSKEYSQSSFYRDMAKLKELGINPITFGDIEENTFKDIECLKNFLAKE